MSSDPESQAVRPQGDEWCVSFVYESRRFNLGTYPTRALAVAAYRRRLLVETQNLTSRRALQRAAAMGTPRTRVRESTRENERLVSPYVLALLVSYDPDTGRLRPTRGAGGLEFTESRPAGRDGTPRMMCSGATFRSARVAWCLHTGAWPDGRVDWRDGDRGNLRWSNLRLRRDEPE